MLYGIDTGRTMIDDEVGNALLLDSIVEAGEKREDKVVVANEGVPRI